MRASSGLLRTAPPLTHGWLRALRLYLMVVLTGNLVWEAAQLPLYTIWKTGTTNEIAFAVVHCTGGDLLIALSALTAALVLIGNDAWPRQRSGRVALLTIAFGVGYTIFSEWWNVDVRRNWGYSGLMPVVPLLGTGLSPLLQWIIVPALALRRARPSSTVSRAGASAEA